jgi:hypothetical protein
MLNNRALKVLRAALAAALLALSFSSPAFASDIEPNKIFVENTTPEFVVGEPGKPEPEYSVEVLVSGSTPGELRVNFADTFEPGSSPPSIEGGSLPSSLTNVMQLKPLDLSYEPDGSTQRYLLVFTIKPGYEKRPFYGNMRIAFVPVTEGSENTSNTIGVIKNLLVTPFGWAGENPSEERTFSSIDSNKVSAASSSGILNGLIPDLPFLINQGPVQAKVRVTNLGVYPNNTWIEWRFYDGDVLLAKKRIPEEFMRGGKSLDASFLVTYTDEVTGRTIDVLPTFRVIRYELTVQSELSGFDYEAQTDVQYFVIAPWKETVAALVVLLVALSAFRRFRSARASNPTDNV